MWKEDFMTQSNDNIKGTDLQDSNGKETDRAFMINVKLGGLLNRKVESITISDGVNAITLSPYDWFVIYTDKPLNEAIIKHR